MTAAGIMSFVSIPLDPETAEAVRPFFTAPFRAHSPGRFILDRGLEVGFAAAGGAAFDPDDPLHQLTDLVRWAEWIRDARAAGGYAHADSVRSTALGTDHEVRIVHRGGVIVAVRLSRWQGSPPIPAWGGFSEWCQPGDERGRRVIERCFNRDGSLHSVKVQNWTDHPNLSQARKLGIPSILWEREGQENMEHSGSCWWLHSQLEAIDATLAKRAVDDAAARLQAEAAAGGTATE